MKINYSAILVAVYLGGTWAAVPSALQIHSISGQGKWMQFPDAQADLRNSWGSVYWNANVDCPSQTQRNGTIGHFITSSGAWSSGGPSIRGPQGFNIYYGALCFGRGLDWWGIKLDDPWGSQAQTNYCFLPSEPPCDTADPRFCFVGDGNTRYVSLWARESAASYYEFGVYEVTWDVNGQVLPPTKYQTLTWLNNWGLPRTASFTNEVGKFYGFYYYTGGGTDYRLEHTDSEWNRINNLGDITPSGQTLNGLNFTQLDANYLIADPRVKGFQHFAVFREPAGDKDWFQSNSQEDNDTLWVGIKDTDPGNLCQADFNDFILRIGRSPPHPICGARIQMTSASPGPETQLAVFNVPGGINESFTTTVRIQNDYASSGDISSLRLRLRDHDGLLIPLGGDVQFIAAKLTLNGTELAPNDYFWNNFGQKADPANGIPSNETLEIGLVGNARIRPSDVFAVHVKMQAPYADDEVKRAALRFQIVAEPNFNPLVTLAPNLRGAGFLIWNDSQTFSSPGSKTANAGVPLAIEARPNPGWVFRYFSGGLTGTVNPQTFSPILSTTIVANFAKASPVLTARVVNKSGTSTNRNWGIEIKNTGPVDATSVNVSLNFALTGGLGAAPATPGVISIPLVPKDGGTVMVSRTLNFAGSAANSRFTVAISMSGWQGQWTTTLYNQFK